MLYKKMAFNVFYFKLYLKFCIFTFCKIDLYVNKLWNFGILCLMSYYNHNVKPCGPYEVALIPNYNLFALL